MDVLFINNSRYRLIASCQSFTALAQENCVIPSSPCKPNAQSSCSISSNVPCYLLCCALATPFWTPLTITFPRRETMLEGSSIYIDIIRLLLFQTQTIQCHLIMLILSRLNAAVTIAYVTGKFPTPILLGNIWFTNRVQIPTGGTRTTTLV